MSGAASPIAGATGLYGKLPARGDFITRSLARPFTDGWDAWLQPAINCSREQLGEGWVDIYLTSPLWHFVLPGGLCGPTAMAGVLMPSVDRVGRYFPLTIAAPLNDGAAAARLPAAMSAWFDWAETLALTCLEDDFDFDGLEEVLAGAPAADAVRPGGVFFSPMGLRAPLAGDGPETGVQAIADGLLAQTFGRCSLWWTKGSELVTPTMIATPGLPRTASFAALLDGDWDRWGWSAEPARELSL